MGRDFLRATDLRRYYSRNHESTGRHNILISNTLCTCRQPGLASFRAESPTSHLFPTTAAGSKTDNLY